jgi:hypothetical protein
MGRSLTPVTNSGPGECGTRHSGWKARLRFCRSCGSRSVGVPTPCRRPLGCSISYARRGPAYGIERCFAWRRAARATPLPPAGTRLALSLPRAATARCGGCFRRGEPVAGHEPPGVRGVGAAGGPWSRGDPRALRRSPARPGRARGEARHARSRPVRRRPDRDALRLVPGAARPRPAARAARPRRHREPRPVPRLRSRADVRGGRSRGGRARRRGRADQARSGCECRAAAFEGTRTARRPSSPRSSSSSAARPYFLIR